MFLKSYYFLKSINNLPGFSGLMRVAEGVFLVFYFFICCFYFAIAVAYASSAAVWHCCE